MCPANSAREPVTAVKPITRELVPNLRQRHHLCHPPVQIVEDIRRRAARCEQRVPEADLVIWDAGFRERGDIREFRMAFPVSHREHPQLAVLHRGRDNGEREMDDCGMSADGRGDRRGPTLEGHMGDLQAVRQSEQALRRNMRR